MKYVQSNREKIVKLALQKESKKISIMTSLKNFEIGMVVQKRSLISRKKTGNIKKEEN